MGMTTIGMNYKVRAGKEEVFERAFKAVHESIKAAPGHQGSWLYKDTADGGSYLVISEWTNRADFDAFIRSEAFAKVTNWGKEQILSERPKHQVYSAQPLH